jgi:quinol monooxygenase YgiN
MRFTARAGHGTDLVDALAAVLPDTAAFPGCLGVELFRETEDGDQVSMLERWESPDAYAAYMAWRASEPPTNVGSWVDGPPARSILELVGSFS